MLICSNQLVLQDTGQYQETFYLSDEGFTKQLKKDIIHHEITDFYTGGAIGWDTLAAQVLLKIRESYPQVKLHLILPCSNAEQTEKWTAEQKRSFTEFYHLQTMLNTLLSNILTAV